VFSESTRVEDFMIETVKGDEAARLLLDHAGAAVAGRGLVFLTDLARHFSRFPYENISKIIRFSRSRDPALSLRMPVEVVTEHIERNFGGTCFSLTFLLERVLVSLGFNAYKVMARMNSGRNIHCLVIVREGGSAFLIDPGYALHEVIRLPETTTRVKCPHGVVEVVRSSSGELSLWTEDRSGCKWRYAFQDCPVGEAEFEKYWIDSFSRPTLNNICLTRMTQRGHIYIRKDFFKLTSGDTIEKRKLRDGVASFIESEFGIGSDLTRTAQAILMKRREGL
jgi:arylamine N-acetyltransferase